MPPKRKAPVAKAPEIVNGSESVEPVKPKRGKITKPEKVDKVDVKENKTSTRSTRAKAPVAVVEKNTTEAENTKEKKAKTKTGQVKKAEADGTPTKKAATKKKDIKATKDAKEKLAATKPKTNAKASPKAKRATRAKKNDDETENEPESSKATATVTSKSVSMKDEPKAKKSRAKPAEATSDSLQNKMETDYAAIDFTYNDKNPTGKVPNLKISCWNVDGLRAWIKKNGMEYIKKENPNILCLQETKCSQDKIPDELNKFMDYKAYWCISDKDGYAGVALFTLEEPLSVTYGIENEEFDDEGRCITAEYEKYYVVNVYVPNAGRGLVTLPKRLTWNTIFNEYIAKLDEQKPVIVCGDMNVAHNEIDIANPKANKKNAGFTMEEREGMTEFLSDKYMDTFRALYPEREKAYTFWSYMQKARAKDIGWRLDYFIVSKRLMDNVCDNVIRNEVFGSDHCPIVLYLNV